MADNSRLEASLKVAKKTSRKTKGREYYFSNPKNAKKAQASRAKRMKTICVRIHADAVELAKVAWPNTTERVKEVSSAIREKAQSKLKI